jgi:hypothetical protein
MTDDLDRRLAALFDAPLPPSDPGFTARVIALATHDLSVRRARRRALFQLGKEALALAAVLASFALLARHAPDAAGMGDHVALGSPALLGVALIALWGIVATRTPSAA